MPLVLLLPLTPLSPLHLLPYYTATPWLLTAVLSCTGDGQLAENLRQADDLHELLQTLELYPAVLAASGLYVSGANLNFRGAILYCRVILLKQTLECLHLHLLNLAVCSALRSDPLVFAGISSGARMSCWLALRHP